MPVWRDDPCVAYALTMIWYRHWGPTMAKTRKRTVSKTTKKARTSSKKGTMARTRHKSVAPKKSKSARKARVGKPIPKAPESFSQKVAAAFHTIVDTLSDAEQLHRKLDPGVSREPE
jgi:hypothetical protein